MTFKELNIIQPILKAIEEKGYNRPTPIQQQAIPVALSRKDILGCAQTGTGKTASFAIPIIQLLQADPIITKRKGVKALILTPTRELALQISECLDDSGAFARLDESGVSQPGSGEIFRARRSGPYARYGVYSRY